MVARRGELPRRRPKVSWRNLDTTSQHPCLPSRLDQVLSEQKTFDEVRQTKAPRGLFFFLDLDTQRFEKLEILIVDLEFGICRQSGDQRRLVGGFLALLANPNGGLKD